MAIADQNETALTKNDAIAPAIIQEVVSTSFFEDVIIQLLFNNVTIREKIVPFLTVDVFNEPNNIAIIKNLQKFFGTYDKFPTQSEMKIFVEDTAVYQKLINNIKIDLKDFDHSFINNEIEEFFKKQLILICL